MAESAALPVRAFLLHLTHYDPVWIAKEDRERGFNLNVAMEVLDAMADSGLNTLVLACSDGMEYRSHPELRRPYTIPREQVRALLSRAHELGLDVVPKLNFSQSQLHQHNHWMRPHNLMWGEGGKYESDDYYRVCFEIIDEVISVVKPKRFFHIGMDEDHWRSMRQYGAAITRLHRGLRQRKLHAMVWNDSVCTWPAAELHKEKALSAERSIPHGVLEVLWCYWDAPKLLAQCFRRLSREGFDFWGAPGGKPEQVAAMRRLIIKHGGSGMLLTRWIACLPSNRQALLEHIRTLGPLL